MGNRKTDRRLAGFTLVELMVAMALSALVMTGVYRGFVAVTIMGEVQEQERELLQSLRFAMGRMVAEIRMAGYGDPSNRVIGAGFGADTTNTARWNNVRLTFDLNQDGDLDDPGEDITYALSNVANANGAFSLTRTDNNGGGGAQPVIDNVDSLSFVYLDGNGADLQPPVGGVNASASPAVALSQNIREVRVSLVVRTSDMDTEFTNNFTYFNLQDSNGDNPPGNNDVILAAQGDNFRRHPMTIEVRCRNMGL